MAQIAHNLMNLIGNTHCWNCNVLRRNNLESHHCGKVENIQSLDEVSKTALGLP